MTLEFCYPVELSKLAAALLTDTPHQPRWPPAQTKPSTLTHPPPANVTLQFSYPVELSKLASALRLAPGKGGGPAPNSKLSVLPCRSWDLIPTPRPIILAASECCVFVACMWGVAVGGG